MFEPKSDFKYYETCRVNEAVIDERQKQDQSKFILSARKMQFRTRKMNNIPQDDLPVKKKHENHKN